MAEDTHDLACRAESTPPRTRKTTADGSCWWSEDCRDRDECQRSGVCYLATGDEG